MGDDIEKIAAELRSERALVLKNICPSCGKHLTITRDPRQVGPIVGEGSWHNVKCHSCDYRADWVL